MNDHHLQKIAYALEALGFLKKKGMLNPVTARMLISAHTSSNPQDIQNFLGRITLFSELVKASPFDVPDSTVNGSIGLALSENNHLIGMYPYECHVLIAGQTGMGKSTLLRAIFSQALAQGVKVWLFTRSTEMRDLIDIDRKTFVASFDGTIKLNLLNPCNIPEEDYCNVFLDIFIQSQSLYDGTKNYLLEHLNSLYKKFREQRGYPSMHDLYWYIKAIKHPAFGRAIAYRDSALNRLGGMVLGTLGRVLDCSQGYEDLLLNRSCIFEIGNLTREQQVFTLNILLTKLFLHRLRNPDHNWFFIGVDDGNLIFDVSFEKRPDLGLPVIHHLLSTVRKSKINVFCCTQTPHQVGASIHSNSAIKIMFSLSNGQDIEFMQRSMGNLDKEQKEFCFSLDKRQIVIKNSLRFPTPVFGIVPEISEAREVSDEEVSKNNERILSSLPPVIPRGLSKDSKESEKPKETITDAIKQFIMAVNLYQYKKTLTEITKLAGFSAGTGSRISKQCVKRKLVKILQVNFGRGNPKYPILLPDAYKILGIEEKKFYGKGAGQEHILYQHLIAEHFKEHKPTIELNRGDKFIDVAIETNELLIGIEVAMTSTHEKENILKDFLKANADCVVVACEDKKVLKEVQDIVCEMPGEIQNRTQVVLISELLNKKLDEFTTNLFIERREK